MRRSCLAGGRCIDFRGWTVQTVNNACGVSVWRWNPPGSAWYAQHLWEHFAFGRDIDYIRNTACPILKWRFHPVPANDWHAFNSQKPANP